MCYKQSRYSSFRRLLLYLCHIHGHGSCLFVWGQINHPHPSGHHFLFESMTTGRSAQCLLLVWHSVDSILVLRTWCLVPGAWMGSSCLG
jgi:hypothetical protein